MGLRKVWKMLHNKRAFSAVISNVILVGAVIAVSFVVLFWTQYRSSAYNEQYSEAMNADIARLKERLAFEYVFYNTSASPKTLSVYIMNCGTIGNVTVKTVYISKSTGEPQVFSNISLTSFDGSQTVNYLNIGEEGKFVLSPINLVAGTYSVRVVTGRGSTFDHTFIA